VLANHVAYAKERKKLMKKSMPAAEYSVL